MAVREHAARILIVDNEVAIVRTLSRALARSVSIETAMSAREALAKMETATFDAVITDHDMPPGESGVSLLREIRARFPSVRRLLMSGQSAKEFEGECSSGLVQGFLAKPFAAAAVLELLGLAPSA